MEQVRAAYRRAACEYHPDLQEGDSLHAEHKLRELIVAYKAIASRLNPAAWSRGPHEQRKIYTPGDFAREGYDKRRQAAKAVDAEESSGLLARMRSRNARPTRDETRTFALLWVLAVAVGIVFATLAVGYRARQVGFENMSAAETLLGILVGEIAYVVLATAAIVSVMLTRKLVRLTLRLANSRWLFLPKPKPDRTLPPPDQRLDRS